MAKKKNRKERIQREKLVQPISSTNTSFPPLLSNPYFLPFILFFVSILIYAGTLGHEFTQDDAIVLTDNDYTKAGDIESLLKYDTFKGFFKVEGKDGLVAGGRYRPLTPIMFAVGWQSTQEPAWFHAMNLLWYGLTVVMLYIVLLKMLDSGKEGDLYPLFVAFVTAFLFAIHPVHTEVVANVKGRDEIMTLFLSLSALYFSLKSYKKDEAPNIAYMALAGVLFFLALMAKEMAVVMIPIVAISFYVFRKETLLTSSVVTGLLQMIPYVIAFVLFWFGIRATVLGEAASISSGPIMEPMNNPFLKYSNGVVVEMTSGEKFGTIFYSLGKYIQLLIFPHTLTHDYYPYSVPTTGLSDSASSFPMLIYAALSAVGIWGVLKRKHFAYGIAFFLISIFLVSNIPVVIGVNMAERFLFMPSVGFCFLVAVGLYALAEKLNDGKRLANFGQMTAVLMILGMISLLGIYKTVDRSMDWKTNDTLFESDWQKSKNSAKIRNAMGGSLTDRSQKAGIKGTPQEKEMLNDALMHLNAASNIHPNYKSPYLIKGNAHLYLGNYDEAIKNYQIILQQLDSDDPNAVKNLQIAEENKRNSGILAREAAAEKATEMGDFAGAIRIFTELKRDYPNEEAKYLFFIGVTKGRSGDDQAALENFLKALDLDDGKDVNNTNRILGAVISVYAKLGNQAKVQEYQARIVQ